jgi:hypothetical protein
MNIRRAAVIVAVVFVCACSASTAQCREAGKKMDFKGFSKLDISGPFDVEVTQSDKFDVTFTVDEKHYSKTEVNQSGDTLKIAFKNHHGCGNCKMNVKISMPTLTAVDLGGAVDTSISGFKGVSHFKVDLSDASSLKGDIEAGDIDMDLSGASDVELTGSTTKLNLELSGASSADLERLSVAVANAELSGASDAELTVNSELSVDLSGASDLTYSGNPTLKSVDTSGASSLKHR